MIAPRALFYYPIAAPESGSAMFSVHATSARAPGRRPVYGMKPGRRRGLRDPVVNKLAPQGIVTDVNTEM